MAEFIIVIFSADLYILFIDYVFDVVVFIHLFMPLS